MKNVPRKSWAKWSTTSLMLKKQQRKQPATLAHIEYLNYMITCFPFLPCRLFKNLSCVRPSWHHKRAQKGGKRWNINRRKICHVTLEPNDQLHHSFVVEVALKQPLGTEKSGWCTPMLLWVVQLLQSLLGTVPSSCWFCIASKTEMNVIQLWRVVRGWVMSYEHSSSSN